MVLTEACTVLRAGDDEVGGRAPVDAGDQLQMLVCVEFLRRSMSSMGYKILTAGLTLPPLQSKMWSS